MRKIIYTTQIINKEYSLYLSDEEGFLRTCLEKRIPAAALIPNTKYIENSLKTSNADLGFFPWAAEDETSLSGFNSTVYRYVLPFSQTSVKPR